MRDHGGRIDSYAQAAGIDRSLVADFSASINPLGPPSWTRSLVNRYLTEISAYPQPESEALIQRLAAEHKVSENEVIAGNGASELLFAIPKSIACEWSFVIDPTYGDYRTASEAATLPTASIPLARATVDESERYVLDRTSLTSYINQASTAPGRGLVWLASPNNPTGEVTDPEILLSIIDEHRQHLFVLDESFLGFTDTESLAASAPARENLIVVRSLTKLYAVPGLRIGYAVGHASLIARIRDSLPWWRVNALAARFAVAALDDTEYLKETKDFVAKEREWITRQLEERIGPQRLRCFHSDANYLLVELIRGPAGASTPSPTASRLAEATLRHGIAIRDCTQFAGLGDRFVRIAVRTRTENERLLSVLEQELGDGASSAIPGPRRTRQRRSLMIQGTASNAGKSVLTTAFCRILLRRGYRVAPFKAQNMSLNSFVTVDGGEMGRAQVTQAYACRVEPSVEMNPVLLKPHTHQTSQVIVRGKPVDELQARDYYRRRVWLREVVHESYDRLADQYDVVVLEGAGSPGEVNLKQHDIVNMSMARYAASPVLLAGDIDRGGVFASFIGTMGVLDEWERNLVKGFLVNRFRGDKSLLGNALDYTEDYTGVPVLGVIPMIADLGLPEEDSVTFKDHAVARTDIDGSSVLTIGLVDLPHISNFTDVDAFAVEPGVTVSRIRSPDDVHDKMDAIIIPGSKSVVADLTRLREQGTDRAILAAAERGTEVVGICGGYQMLGKGILDPDGVESPEKRIPGLGLLDVTTTMAKGKTLQRSTAVHDESGCEITGYEIHHGQTVPGSSAVQSVLRDTGSAAVASDRGARSRDGQIWGTYLHGVFDRDEFRLWFINRLRERRSLPPVEGRPYEIESAIDRVADVVEQSVEMERVLELIEDQS